MRDGEPEPGAAVDHRQRDTVPGEQERPH
jgi:hypothetical protein